MFCVVNSTTEVVSPLHTTWSAISSTCAVGLTVIVKILSSPIQAFPSNSNSGVTVIVAKTGSFVEFIAVKFILSFPDRPAPIWISDTQLYEVEPKVFCVVNTTLTSSPLQTTWSKG